MQKTKHELRLAEWREMVLECRNSGQKVRDWCRERGIREATYYRWQRMVWDAEVRQVENAVSSAESLTFAEYLPVSDKETLSLSGFPSLAPSMVVHIRDYRLEIMDGADPTTIERVMSSPREQAGYCLHDDGGQPQDCPYRRPHGACGD